MKTQKRWLKTKFITHMLSLCLGLGIIFVSTQTFAQSCTNLAGWTPGSTPDGGSITGYKATDASYTETCTQLSKKLTCTNGSFNIADANTYKYQTCTPHTRANCSSPTGANHLQYKTLYKFPQASQTETCVQASKSLQCINGSFTGTNANLYQSATCQDQNRLPCINGWTNTYFDHLDTIQGYLASTSSTTQSCNALSIQLKCMNGQRSGSNGQRYTTSTQTSSLYSGCTDLGALGCQFTGGLGVQQTIPNGLSGSFYSTILRTVTGQNYTDCSPYSGTLTCTNGVIQGGAGTYKYTLSECQNTLAPKPCILPRGISRPGTNESVTGYSATVANYPNQCNDYAAALTCVNGLLNGNYQTYQYVNCNNQGWPTEPVDLELQVQTPPAGETMKFAQYSAPQLTISITNKGLDTLTANNIIEGFLQCEWNGINIYKSRVILQFVANPMVPQTLSITLKDIFTQSLGAQKHITCRLNKDKGYYTAENVMTNNKREGDVEVVTASRFDIAMERAISPIKKNLDAPEITSALGGAETIKEFVLKKVMDILVPLVIVIGILIAIIGFYKMFFSTEDTATQEGIKYIAYGLIGIVIIMSAKFIGNTMFNILTPTSGEISGSLVAQGVYNDLVYPFIKLAMYLVLGVMFIILVGRVLTFLFGSSDDAKKKAGTIIGRNIIAMIIIIGAKQIVEAIYGKADQVTKDISNLGEIGSGILSDKNIPILYHIINWVMGLTSLAVLLIIIFQTFQLLTKPDSPEQMKSLKNSLLYVFIGLMVIGAGYLITNFLIVS